MRTATIKHLDNGNVELRTPYDVEFVDRLKSCVPHVARKWVPERKVWIVSSEFSEQALHLVKEYFLIHDTEDQQRQEQRQKQQEQPHGSNPYTTLYLLPTAPEELIKAAYRCLALLYHPDRGGDTAKMQEVIAAYEKLTK